MILLTILAAATAVHAAPQPVREVNHPTPPAQVVFIADAARGAERSEVLVLGTAHLSSLPADFDRTRFNPLLDRLAQWRPQIIAIEALSGAQCDYLRAFKFAYPDTAEDYCPDPTPARTALGIDQARAEAEIEQILAKSAQERPPAQRRRLAVLFLAAGDPASARLQWLRLPVRERATDSAITAELAERLNRSRGPNENYDLAVALAVRLGLDRVYPVDDHTGDRATGPNDQAFGEALMAIWKGTPGAELARGRYEAGMEKFKKDGDVLAWYRDINSQRALTDAIRFDFAAAAADRKPEGIGRRYLAYWETRNLRMVANIREAMGPVPGARVLAIVGSSHKPYYERYLGVLSEVRLVDVRSVLK